MEDLVVGLRAHAPAQVEAVADAHALHRLDRHDRLRQPPVQALLPGHVRADAGHQPEGDRLVDAAQRLVGLPRGVDLRHHRLGGLWVQAAHGRLVDPVEVGHDQVVCCGCLHRADLQHVRAHLHSQRAQVDLGQRPGAHPRRGLARAGALEHVANVGEAELLDPGQVGVTGARQMHLLHPAVDRPRVHPLLPVGVVAVGHPQGDRPAEGAPVAHAGGDLGAVLLDLHPAAAAVSQLPARQVAIDVGRGQLEPGGQALDHGREAGPVGLTGGREADRHRAPHPTGGICGPAGPARARE